MIKKRRALWGMGTEEVFFHLFMSSVPHSQAPFFSPISVSIPGPVEEPSGEQGGITVWEQDRALVPKQWENDRQTRRDIGTVLGKQLCTLP